MSANNLIIIKELIDGTYISSDIDIDTGRNLSIGKAETLGDAISKVVDYMNENEVEYGYIVVRQGEIKSG